MEKDTEKNSYMLKEERQMGTVKIADNVVETIAAMAAADVDGVHSSVGSLSGEVMNKVGLKKLKRGVRVEVLAKEIRCDMALTLEYGYSIPAICQKVQEKVKSTIETMTGLPVSDVNIRIVGVHMAKGK